MKSIALSMALMVSACGHEAAPGAPGIALNDNERALLATMAPAAYPGAPADISNRFSDDPSAAAFGKTLFFDPMFSGALWDGDNDGSKNALGMYGDTGKVSCAGCHQAGSVFADARSIGHTISLAASWTKRRTPSLLDISQARLLMWDGRDDSLFSQIFGPLEARNEMNSSRLYVAEQTFERYRAEYEKIFGAMPALDDVTRFAPLTDQTTGCQGRATIPKSCHGMPGDHAEYDAMVAEDQDLVTTVVVNLGKAIAAYERHLSCGAGRFDQWVQGDATALTLAEQRGAQVFLGKGECVSCHSGPFLSDQRFHNVGLHAALVAEAFSDGNDPGASVGVAALLASPLNTRGKWSDGDDGRLPAAVTDAMLGAFRTPSLRCVSQRPSFLHTGQMQSLVDVVRFFSEGGHPYGYQGTNELKALALSDDEQSDLVAFLHTLDGPGPSDEWLP